ncbi:MAG: extracellular solute-binding protein [Candidatus Izemoplasmatales bacterium]|uniref:Extracellular solute-binding protein n=1 Tax=Hujiaoplasma nucleasis TaxID=2725268 RepID=A0A7L6N6B8_9MOLU|nr:extracellular solute-binding protein [Hujiaoplasma nucleasis]QLY40807.1 extracellular solute-binding protein [Hujiaoplasma nucleasis]
MKKILALSVLFLVLTLVVGCSQKEKLYVLNWGEYMDPELIEKFEDEFNVDVVYEEVGSNEEMEIKLKQGITDYDIMIPSEYMVDKLSQENLLLPIDYDLLPNLDLVSFFEDARVLYENEDFGDYMVPYFFGTIGIMYNTESAGIEQAIENEGFCALFDEDSTYRIGLYDSPRDTVGAALMCLGYSVNSNDDTELSQAQALIESVLSRSQQLTSFGQDGLKGDVARGNLDMALVYSGDYFEMVFEYEEAEENIEFNYFAPSHTNIWIDAFVIPKTSQNTNLAHEFINFFLGEDVAVQNADWVGYTPVIEEVYNILVTDYEYDYDHYYPQPIGSTREVFHYISEEHSQNLNTLLNAVRSE